MNVPAKRFSLTRILGNVPPPAAPVAAETAPPAAPKDAVPVAAPAPVLAVMPPTPTEFIPLEEVAQVGPKTVVPDRKGRAPRATPAELRHPKKKRSYSVDMEVCEDLELLAWYQHKSSSSVVEELVRRYLANHREEVDKARVLQSSR